MGRLFLVELEGPVYKCKFCQTGVGLRDDIVSKLNLGVNVKIYEFSRLFNMFMEAARLPYLNEIFCVRCSALFGIYHKDPRPNVPKTYSVMRGKVLGPEGGSDDEV